MRNFFHDKFDEVYDFESIRKLPFNNEELKEALPFQEDRIEYLNLFKELYEEALLFHCHPKLGLVKHNTYPNEVKTKYKKLLDFLLLKNLIDYSVYQDLGGPQKEWDKHYIPLNSLAVTVFRYREYKSAYVIETLDEYRLRLEEYFAQLDSRYLELRYSVSECFSTENSEYNIGLYRYDTGEDQMKECGQKEIKVLFDHIKKDLNICEHAIEELSSLIPDESDADFFEKYYQWFERRKQLDFEQEKLEACLETVEEQLNDFPNIDENLDTIVPQFKHKTILYIYFGDVKCHKQKHTIVPATAIVSGRNGSDIELNIEYCKDCDKCLLRYQSFEEYRKKYGIVIGNFREVYNEQFNGSFDLALESPLKLSGYTVGQKEGLSQKERHYILATIIHNEIMNKGEVIRYLNYFIKMQGAKPENGIAVQKWKDDLMFVQEYNKNIQPKVYIRDIKKY